MPGSSLIPGWLYHDYPLPETLFQSHRRNSSNRLLKLKDHLPIYKARILDLGCSSGGISVGLALLGASQVVGIDYDSGAIKLGQAIAAKYEISNVEFLCGSIESSSLPEVDIVVWLSQWMWSVKLHGLEYSKDLLFEVPKKTGALIMAFESAANDGMAAIPDATQADIERFLRTCTPYSIVENIGPFDDKWREPGKERMVFVCSAPQLSWNGIQADVTRIDRNTVIKRYKREYLWAKDIEVECLSRLRQFPCFPKILDCGDDWIEMNWVGNRARLPEHLSRLDEIVQILSSAKITHRDICPENLLYLDGQLYLIDFGWAVVDGIEPPMTPPPRLGRDFYEYGDWDDATAARKVINWFQSQSQRRR